MGIMTIALMMMPNLIRAGPVTPDAEMAIAQDVATAPQMIADNYAYIKTIASAPVNLTAQTSIMVTTTGAFSIEVMPAPTTAILTGQVIDETAYRTSSSAVPAQAPQLDSFDNVCDDGAWGTISPLARCTQQADLLNHVANFLKGNDPGTARNANATAMTPIATMELNATIGSNTMDHPIGDHAGR
jgi:hypothetical protein